MSDITETDFPPRDPPPLFTEEGREIDRLSKLFAWSTKAEERIVRDAIQERDALRGRVSELARELSKKIEELAAAIKQRDEARDTAAAIHRRNWYEAKTEYGTALGKVRAELAAALRALQKAHDAMVLAQTSHNRVLTCDPPIDAWKHRCVDVHLGEAIRECAAAMRKGGGA